MGTRTIDEGSMDEGSGMNFSEYVAVLSGNTDLLEKAKLEKKIASLESERQAFNRSKSSAIYKYEDMTRSIDGNNEMIARVTKDFQQFNDKVQADKDGNKLNPVKLDNLDTSDPKAIGDKLNELANNARTNGEYFKIGELYGFKILIKTEESLKEGSLFRDNRFFIEGEGGIKYSYNNGHIATDPLLAAKNFINALEKIPNLMEKYQADNQKLEKDIPVLKEVIASVFRKEPELRELKSQLDSLNRQINLSLENKDKAGIEQQQQPDSQPQVAGMQKNDTVKTPGVQVPKTPDTPANIRSGQPMTIKDIVEANPGRVFITATDTGGKIDKPENRQDAELKKNKGRRM